jgi:hypothetical protein
MKHTYYVLSAVCIGLLGGCATTDDKQAAPDTGQAAPAAPAVPAAPPAPPSPPPPESKPSASSKELDEEAQRLSGMQKTYLTVFKIDESGSGLKPRPNASGVFDMQKPPRSDRLRLVVTQQAKKPPRLAVGTYNVTLDTVIDYVETQTCKSGSCSGKQQKMVRQLPKQVRIQISPLNQYNGAQEVSLATAGTPGNYRSTYSNVAITVKRITVAPVAPAATTATASPTPARQE